MKWLVATALVDFYFRWGVRTRGIGGGGGGGGRKLIILDGDECDGCSKKTPLFITLVRFIILEGLMLHVICNPVL